MTDMTATPTVSALRAKAQVLRGRGKANTLHDINQTADYLDAVADVMIAAAPALTARHEAPASEDDLS